MHRHDPHPFPGRSSLAFQFGSHALHPADKTLKTDRLALFIPRAGMQKALQHIADLLPHPAYVTGKPVAFEQ